MTDHMHVETPVPQTVGAVRGKSVALQMLINGSHTNTTTGTTNNGNGYRYSPRNPSPLAAAMTKEDEDEEEEDNDDDDDDKQERVEGVGAQPMLKKSYSVDGNGTDGELELGMEMAGEVWDESRTASNCTIISNGDKENVSVVPVVPVNGIVAAKRTLALALIPLFVHGDHVLVFDSRDMKMLSVKYGITGQLAGTLPLAPQQNSLLGFPWRLSLYEVLWLVGEKVCMLVDAEDAILKHYIGQKWLEDDEMQEDLALKLKNQLDVWRDEKQREIEEQMKKLNIVKKERKVMKPLDNVMLVSSASMPDLQQVINDSNKKEQEMKEQKRKQREMHEKSKRNKIVFMETPTCDDRERLAPYIRADTSTSTHIQTQKRLLQRLIDIESGGNALHERKIRQNVLMYAYLKGMGHSLLPGMRFGGTFVSYPGDPLRYHAHQIVETAEYYNEDIRLFRLCNRGRLATGVRKVWVIGGSTTAEATSTGDDYSLPLPLPHDYEDAELRCFSIEWAGF
jgi:tRNA-splicing endonuclease subunit Sen34